MTAGPKLRGLMQEKNVGCGVAPYSLTISGITRGQRAPLNQAGRGVVICFIDTEN